MGCSAYKMEAVLIGCNPASATIVVKFFSDNAPQPIFQIIVFQSSPKSVVDQFFISIFACHGPEIGNENGIEFNRYPLLF